MRDFLLDSNYDLRTADGDFVLGESTNQHVEVIFKVTPGELKENLDTGVSINRAINGNIDRFLDRTIRVQMAADNYKISALSITQQGISIDGSYE